ncbi:hypothetical protein WEI85_19835 [Actinomycetes bacterium KLBMP 9797]
MGQPSWTRVHQCAPANLTPPSWSASAASARARALNAAAVCRPRNSRSAPWAVIIVTSTRRAAAFCAGVQVRIRDVQRHRHLQRRQQ